MNPSDTIAAIATAPQPAAIGILRLSGPEAVTIAEQCFRPLGSRGLTEHAPRELVYGDLLDREGRPFDRCLCTYSRGPHSYTGEDTVEFQCHGAPMVLTMGLEVLRALGARQAGPGEFTRRAFLNGRLDLVQAEAVADLLDARSRAGALHAAGQLTGALSRRIEGVYQRLTDLMAHFCAVLDYPEEDIDPFGEKTIREALEFSAAELDRLLAGSRRGQYLKEGIPCAIVGRPNAGKSSLLNALVGYDRAIVTDVPGTTRDTVEELCELGGVPLRLIDTAGLRETEDKVERLGVERSRAALERARLVLVVMDQSQPPLEEDFALLREAMELAPAILVWNKSDLPSAPVPCVDLELPPVVEVSARTGAGLDDLGRAVADLFPAGQQEVQGEILTNARQEDAARRALEAVRRASQALELGITPDAVLSDVEGAMAALGELTGRNVAEDITDRIFSRFCVGK